MELPGAVMIAVILCVVSAGAYATGALLQQRVADQPMRVLLRTPLWWVAIAANGGAALLHVAALRYGPLTLVQALGVLTLVIAVPMGATAARRRISRTEGGATALAVISLCGLTTLFGTTPVAALTDRQLVSLLLVTAAVLVLPAASSRHPDANGLPAAAAGGVAFGVASAITQTLGIQITDAGLIALTAPTGVLAVLAVAGLNAAGVWLTQLSYRHGLAAPLAVSTMANPVAAGAIGMVLLGEHLRGGAAGIVLAVVCTAGIAAAVRQLTTAPSSPAPPRTNPALLADAANSAGDGHPAMTARPAAPPPRPPARSPGPKRRITDMNLDSPAGYVCTPLDTGIVNTHTHTHTHIAVVGVLDRPGAGALHDDVVALLTHTRPAGILVDTHQVTAVDSRALGILVQCQQAPAAAGSRHKGRQNQRA
ncbi:STAS domain-containing protein [Micromonospora echinospora]|uniref:STAS domain-containing protein n=1 Tax=Micromonospora echinospora TaxID=1877 RepID=UPI0037AD21AB